MTPFTILRSILAEMGADSVLLSFLPDIRWTCGFTGSNGLLVVTSNRALFLTDGRYGEQALREVHDAEVEAGSYDLYGAIAAAHIWNEGGTVLVQADHLTLAELDTLSDRFPAVKWVFVKDLLSRFVARKEAWEVDCIRRALAITERVFERVVGFIKPGVTEKELAAEITYGHLSEGADAMSFEPIVASGPNGALPHWRAGSRKLQRGDMIVLDFGCFLEGYASDMTRTVALGEPGEEAREVYRIVLEAQGRALETARSGITGVELDSAARSVIQQAGYGSCFTHSLGHGVGLQIHEWPRIAAASDFPLPENAVVTIEPGVYLPGRFGVRIENMIRLHPTGNDDLTRTPRNLLIL